MNKEAWRKSRPERP